MSSFLRCSVCAKFFRQKVILDQHMRIHTKVHNTHVRRITYGTYDIWLKTGEKWHVTCDTWHIYPIWQITHCTRHMLIDVVVTEKKNKRMKGLNEWMKKTGDMKNVWYINLYLMVNSTKQQYTWNSLFCKY